MRKINSNENINTFTVNFNLLSKNKALEIFLTNKFNIYIPFNIRLYINTKTFNTVII